MKNKQMRSSEIGCPYQGGFPYDEVIRQVKVSIYAGLKHLMCRYYTTTTPKFGKMQKRNPKDNKKQCCSQALT